MNPAIDRVGQVWMETSSDGDESVGLVVESKHDVYLDCTKHLMLIVASDYVPLVLKTQTWNEDEETRRWETYDGLRRVS